MYLVWGIGPFFIIVHSVLPTDCPMLPMPVIEEISFIHLFLFIIILNVIRCLINVFIYLTFECTRTQIILTDKLDQGPKKTSLWFWLWFLKSPLFLFLSICFHLCHNLNTTLLLSVGFQCTEDCILSHQGIIIFIWSASSSLFWQSQALDIQFRIKIRYPTTDSPKQNWCHFLAILWYTIMKLFRINNGHISRFPDEWTT